MNEEIGDQRLRELAENALRLYEGFEEVYPTLLIEAMMRHLPPEFDRSRVERVVSELGYTGAPGQGGGAGPV